MWRSFSYIRHYYTETGHNPATRIIELLEPHAPFDLYGETDEQYIQLAPENVTIFMARYV